jgi:hypothetical protein
VDAVGVTICVRAVHTHPNLLAAAIVAAHWLYFASDYPQCGGCISQTNEQVEETGRSNVLSKKIGTPIGVPFTAQKQLKASARSEERLGQ